MPASLFLSFTVLEKFFFKLNVHIEVQIKDSVKVNKVNIPETEDLLVKFFVKLNIRIRIQIKDTITSVCGVNMVNIPETLRAKCFEQEGLDFVDGGLLEDSAEVHKAVEPVEVSSHPALLHRHLASVGTPKNFEILGTL